MIKTADGITAEWLGAVLGAEGLELVGVEAIGTGQMSKSYRVRYCRPQGEQESVVVKLAATDQNSRAAGVRLGVYQREVRFYRELATRTRCGPLAQCHPAVTTLPTAGSRSCSRMSPLAAGRSDRRLQRREARLAMHELARLHAPVFADPRSGRRRG